ncbi:MAG TPA: extracellular solute-binding protein [Chloroflexota bacterium]|jgi:multiple sugar transport system substrate-binding protein|nr:extracellular solute-binding protein [Chloroflexota bacterium]
MRRLMSRRSVVRGLAALGPLLAACGGAGAPSPTAAPPTKPAESAKPTEVPKPAAAATKPAEQPAGAPAKPAEAAKPTAAPAAAKPAAGGQPVQLTFWRHQYDPTDAILKDLMAKYSQEKPGVTFDYQVQRGDDYGQKMLPQIASGSGPDIFEHGEDRRLQFGKGGVMAPVDYGPWGGQKQYEEYWDPGVVEALKTEGKDFSLPIEWYVFQDAYFINQEFADQAGINWKQFQDRPITWDEIAQLAPKMTVKDASGRITRDGFMIQHGYGAGRIYALWEMQFLQLGGQVVSADGKTSTLSSEQGVQSLQYLYDLVYKHGASMLRPQDKESGSGKLPKWETASTTNLGYWAYATFKSLAKEKWNVIKGCVGPPQSAGKPELYFSGPSLSLAVFAKSTKQAEAWPFLKYLFDRGGDIFESGIVPPTRDWLKKYPGITNLIDGPAWTYPASKAKIRQRHPNEMLTSVARADSFLAAFDAVMFNKAPIKATLDKWNAEVQSALKDL